MKEKLVKTVDADGKKITLRVVKPNNRLQQDATREYNLKVAELMRLGRETGNRLFLRSELDKYLIEYGIWSLDEMQKFASLALDIRTAELMLQRGGIKVSEGKTLAVKVQLLRQEQLLLYQKKQQMDDITIESQADTYRMGYLASNSILDDETGDPFLKDFDDYIDRGDEQCVIDGVLALTSLLYGDTEVAQDTFEVQWLKKYGLMNKKGALVNKKKQLVDHKGKLVDKDGRFVNERGDFVDTNGNRIDEAGAYVVDEPAPFIDDDTGKPIEFIEKKKPKAKKKVAVIGK